MNKLDEFLKSEWEIDKELNAIYDNFDEYRNFMIESIEQYKELEQEVKDFKGTLSKFKDTLEFEYTNYKENEYVDFNYGNLCATVYVKGGKLKLSNMVEIWNDGKGTFEYAAFDINEYLDKY